VSTVPRPERPAQPTEADALRDLLDAVAEALTVPLDACPTMADRHALLAERATAARIAAAGETVAHTDPGARADWLRSYVAEYAPIPAGGAE
jgi:gamma-glutamyl:cysteine ligase YbdK (ATP-grasp superfamily)